MTKAARRPYFPASAATNYAVHTNPSAECVADSFAEQAEHVAEIKRGLS